MRRFIVSIILIATAFFVPIDRSAAYTQDYPVGRTMSERCALARQRVRVPFPDRWMRCSAEPYPLGDLWVENGSAYQSGQCICEPGKVYWFTVYAGTDSSPMPTQNVADEIAHEVGHAYSFLAWDQPDEQWVGSHEPFADHWMRCLTTTKAPC